MNTGLKKHQSTCDYMWPIDTKIIFQKRNWICTDMQCGIAKLRDKSFCRNDQRSLRINVKVGEVPFDQLKIGDNVISCIGKHGTIGAIYPIGSTDPFRNNYDDWGGGLMILWNHQNPPTFSITGWSDSQVEYLGDEPFSNPCHVMCNWRRT